ncbi:hypothetical protein C900_04580 [Fulvivirga imtechensis AK7]|uniref:DUF3953 domain-containing protein n=1 Tax=Fulvivirga imtechensis AK7 TaxID=1237149 RepID=L8JRA2_9BACT|nr:hypothetical protein [Fulvivirga imtechensis]ELR69877.1 hypothetical protein C900_04580 [Fulvivirga imtechensis AK7]
MKGLSIQYLMGGLMVAFSFYQIYTADFWEASLYISAGLAFIVMGLLKNEVFPRQKKILNAVSWLLILLAVFLFLFLVRTDG